MTFEESMYALGKEILDIVGETAADKFLTGDGIPVVGQVTSRTGGLMNSILGGTDSIRKIEVGSDRATFTIGSAKPYAALMELGGVRTVTQKMRRFFRYKYYESVLIGSPQIEMWAALRFKNLIRYLPRPFLRPAAEEVMQTALPKLLEKYTMQFLRTSVQEIITGTPRADVYNAPYKGLSPV